MTSHVIYIITHVVSGRCYIGYTNDIRLRWKDHRRSRRRDHFHNALRHYGSEAFAWEVLEECSNVQEAKSAERFWIAYLKSIGASLFNATEGGEGIWGYRHSDDAKRKIAVSASGRRHTIEAKLKMRGRVCSNDTRLKMSATKQGQQTFLGKQHTEETKDRMRSAQSGSKSLRARLTWNNVVAIRNSELSQKQLAILFGVSQGTISRAKSGATWKEEELCIVH